MPFYLRLANAIERAIVDGLLKPGDKLPPQRDIAFDLKVTVGTIGRAYQIARERGLTTGEVGRGTYVRAIETASASTPVMGGDFPLARGLGTAAPVEPVIALDSTASPDVDQAEEIARTIAEVIRDCPRQIIDYVREVPQTWLEAGTAWLETGGWRPDPANVVPTLGVDAAIQAVVTVTTHPGDRIAFEELCYSTVARGATTIGRLPLAVAMDEEGMLPDDLDRCAARQHPRAIFLTPAANNPTAARMSLKRREEIVSVARRHNLTIIEDNVYGRLMPDAIPPIAALAPERTFFLEGLSKTVAAGLRAGWVVCPRGQAIRTTVAHNMLSGGRPFLNMEAAARLVLSGAAETVKRRVVAEIAARGMLFNRIVAAPTTDVAAAMPFRWVQLPAPWTSPAFLLAARNHNIRIHGEDEYRPVRGERQRHCVRIGLSVVRDRETLAAALTTLKGLIDSGSISYESVA
ncbi:PLP-dependent aminotransferase family protein [Jiella sp. CQZ9-1]|uniref:PLP-dependent aminotransferase family protein n=2 Tax=Jiella flava TaxID=2816857 RepID=A0A939FXD4_9HYPH|nr:PLP-dependent aminotransferase family protein [Jiella flava]MBO0663743.1 PLP-dependent aminotransferase family protein [Jiella flava]